MSHAWFVYVSFLGSWRSWDSVCCQPWRLGTGLTDQVIGSRYIRYDGFVCFFVTFRGETKKQWQWESWCYMNHKVMCFECLETFRRLQPNYRCFRLATLPGCWKRLVLRIVESWCTRARIASLLTEARWNLVDSCLWVPWCRLCCRLCWIFGYSVDIKRGCWSSGRE